MQNPPNAKHHILTNAFLRITTCNNTFFHKTFFSSNIFILSLFFIFCIFFVSFFRNFHFFKSSIYSKLNFMFISEECVAWHETAVVYYNECSKVCTRLYQIHTPQSRPNINSLSSISINMSVLVECVCVCVCVLGVMIVTK